MVEIRGTNIAIRGTETDEIGVWFTPAGGGAAVRVPAEKCAPNTPGLVQFIAPAGLTPGQWTVKLATQMTKKVSEFTSTVREGFYENPVTVQAAPL